jgi:ABC-type glycerol-3-phosphate transport system permease component
MENVVNQYPSKTVSLSFTRPARIKAPRPLKAASKLQTKRSGGTWALFFIVFVIFVFYALSILYPLVWGFIASLKNADEYYLEPANLAEVFALPKKYYWSNYNYAFFKLEDHGVNFLSMFWNSTWFSVGSIAINLLFTSLVAYIISKYKFPGRNFLYLVAVLTMIIPIYGTFPATYALYHNLKMVDSPLILLSATGGFGMNFIILTSYYSNISWTYAEAAMMDGAGHFKIYTRIMRPLARPMLASIFLLGFIGKWNDYMSCLLYLPQKYVTLAGGLFDYEIANVQLGTYPYLFAGCFLSLIPVLILFACLSKTMMKNMTFGGIKG